MGLPAKLHLKWLLVLGWMAVIFIFSAQPASESTRLSFGATMLFLLAASLLGLAKSGAAYDSEIIRMLDNSTRTAVHAGVYLVLGWLMMRAMPSTCTTKKLTAFYAASLCVMYALSDELHQYFVQGRSCSWEDVLVDTLGALTGIGLSLGLSRIRHRRGLKRTGESCL